jgi:hypothetical protein
MKEWLREHWPIIVIIFVVLAAFFVSQYSRRDYKRNLKAKDDFIEHLISEYGALEDSAREARKLAKNYEIMLAVYQDSLNASRIKYFNQKKRYVEEIANLSRIPTDQLYVDVTRWLDSLSVHW